MHWVTLHFTSYTYELETNDEYISLSQFSTPTLRVTRIHETAQGMRHMAQACHSARMISDEVVLPNHAPLTTHATMPVSTC